jgi:membrane associated rhomboid family serine protease
MGMGFYDRDYVRQSGPGFLESLARSGQVCKWLVVINAAVFLLQNLLTPREYPVAISPGIEQRQMEPFDLRPDSSDGEAIEEIRPQRAIWTERVDPLTHAFWLQPQQTIWSGEIWRLLTYAFLHGGLWHIVFNMLFLWMFGKTLEDVYGPKEFLAFYLAAAVMGGVAYTGWSLARGDFVPCVGASAAVTGVMVLFALHFPTVQVNIWGILPVPVWLLVGFQVAQDLFLFAGQFHTPTAVTAHLGGAAFGFLYYKSQGRLMNLLPNWRARRWSMSRPKLRVFHEEPTPTPVPPPGPAVDANEHMEAMLDAVLEKVARTGQASLTDQERQILLRASEIYRRRRS